MGFQAGHSRSPKRTSNEIVYKIRELYATGQYSYGQLASMFGIHENTVGRLCRGSSHHSVAIPAAVAKADADVRAAALRSERTMFFQYGGKPEDLPDYLKTQAELHAQQQGQKIDDYVAEIVAPKIIDSSAQRMVEFQQQITPKQVETTEPNASVYRCDSCGVAEGGEHLESCQDASGGTLVRS